MLKKIFTPLLRSSLEQKLLVCWSAGLLVFLTSLKIKKIIQAMNISETQYGKAGMRQFFFLLGFCIF